MLIPNHTTISWPNLFLSYLNQFCPTSWPCLPSWPLKYILVFSPWAFFCFKKKTNKVCKMCNLSPSWRQRSGEIFSPVCGPVIYDMSLTAQTTSPAQTEAQALSGTGEGVENDDKSTNKQTNTLMNTYMNKWINEMNPQTTNTIMQIGRYRPKEIHQYKNGLLLLVHAYHWRCCFCCVVEFAAHH